MNKLWFRISVSFGIVTSQTLVGLVFFVLITPLAFLMRWFGRDELTLKIKKEKSYWLQRNSKFDSESFHDQF
jgi:hypothetical protein